MSHQVIFVTLLIVDTRWPRSDPCDKRHAIPRSPGKKRGILRGDARRPDDADLGSHARPATYFWRAAATAGIQTRDVFAPFRVSPS